MAHDAKGFCHQHYKRWVLHGDPLIVKRAPKGTPWISRGYICKRVSVNRRIPEPKDVAEKALGKPLPRGAVVHHIDENPLNNEKTNLVICPSPGYHKILHQRLDAFKACGNYNWKKCTFCKTYDDPVNMKQEKSGRHVHAKCRSQVARKRYVASISKSTA
jgi:hypothetical protein